MRNDDDLNNNLGRSEYVNPYSSGGQQYRDMTMKERFLGFFDPQNKMGRVTKDKASRIEANTANFIGGIQDDAFRIFEDLRNTCLLYTSPSPRDLSTSRMPSSA